MQLTVTDETAAAVARLAESTGASPASVVDRAVAELARREAERAAILEGLADVDAGRHRPYREVCDELEARHRARG